MDVGNDSPNGNHNYALLGVIWCVHHQDSSASDWTTGDGDTFERGLSSSAPALWNSVALMPFSKDIGTSWGTGQGQVV